MHNDIKKISVSEEEIASMLKRMGEEISKDYASKKPKVIGLLKGCVPFMTDLLKYVNIPLNVDYIKCSSYDGTKSTGKVTIYGKMPDVLDRDVILVDDILDTGRTLNEVVKIMYEAGAKSVKLCVLLDKPEGRLIDIYPDYVGGLVPNEFVVGYGLDYNEFYRNLPYIGVLKEEIYTK